MGAVIFENVAHPGRVMNMTDGGQPFGLTPPVQLAAK